ncbi:hypothetical protein DDZ14_01445 [Maritimibacter sp. 55A14]|uniref:hypothetical protein n=1 Tax=Maritimibacter sp. 55A14 TaxID=2174844 RepID=UPI000D6140C3|nr:hypothetical protein [Maritimibacter sp. 55A14]PWE34395.1 hypothetical protein DDZ14_01445 [Maritimibacter sp. 55A14]
MTETLPNRLRAYVMGLKRRDLPIAYAALAQALDVPGPGRIARLGAALETLMAEDQAAERPFLAALVISRSGSGIPAPGYFDAATALRGTPDHDHAAEMAAALRHYFTG